MAESVISDRGRLKSIFTPHSFDALITPIKGTVVRPFVRMAE